MKYGAVVLLVASVLMKSIFVHRSDAASLPADRVFCSGRPADVIFLLDSSTSIWEEDFELQLRFVQNMVDLLPIGTLSIVDPQNAVRVGVLTYSHELHLQFHLDAFEDKTSLKHAISKIKHTRGGTFTGEAIRFAYEHMFTRTRPTGGSFQSPDVARILVVTTDGLSQEPRETEAHAAEARSRGIEVFTLGVGPGVDMKELRAIASKPLDRFLFRVTDFSALDSLKETLALRTCEAPTERGETARSYPDTEGRDCIGKPAEIFFLLDASSSIWYPDFQKQVAFMKNVTRLLNIGPSKTRVGVITYSNSIYPEITLDSYDRKSRLLAAMDETKYLMGESYTATAIEYMRISGFSKMAARPGVLKIGIVLTDGQSHDVEATKGQAELARKEGIYMFAIGMGVNAYPVELSQIASDKKYMFTNDYPYAIESIKTTMGLQSCTVLRTFPDEEDRDEIDICPLAVRESDLVFVLDSLSMGAEKSLQILKLIIKIIQRLQIGADKTRVGIISNLHNSAGHIELDEHSSKEALLSRLGTQSFSSLKKLLHHLRVRTFSRFSVRRLGMSKKAIVFIDAKLKKAFNIFHEAERAKLRGIELFVVAIGNDVPQIEASQLCSAPARKHLIHVLSYANLSESSDLVLQKLCVEHS